MKKLYLLDTRLELTEIAQYTKWKVQFGMYDYIGDFRIETPYFSHKDGFLIHLFGTSKPYMIWEVWTDNNAHLLDDFFTSIREEDNKAYLKNIGYLTL